MLVETKSFDRTEYLKVNKQLDSPGTYVSESSQVSLTQNLLLDLDLKELSSTQFKSVSELVQILQKLIADIDQLLTKQLNVILHTPSFQTLESSWRGLCYLVAQTENSPQVKIKLLNFSWQELTKDIERAIEFDQSTLFNKVYHQEFDMPGGEPFGILLGDYKINHRAEHNYPYNDVETLKGISKVAAAAFAPFITNVKSSMFGIDNFIDTELPADLSQVFAQNEYTSWRNLRENEDSRFLGLTMPSVLMRLPYTPKTKSQFCFNEQISRHGDYLWGNSCYNFGAVLIRAFKQTGWLAKIRGFELDAKNNPTNGAIENLVTPFAPTDTANSILYPATETVITPIRANQLNEQGFMVLSTVKHTTYSVYYATPSIQKSKNYNHRIAKTNSNISSMLQYVLCAARFAHYLKVIAREKIGSVMTADELENHLQKWLMNYITASDDISPELKAKYPLREGRVTVQQSPGMPGSFFCTMHLKPHFQLDQINSLIELTTQFIQN